MRGKMSKIIILIIPVLGRKFPTHIYPFSVFRMIIVIIENYLWA